MAFFHKSVPTPQFSPIGKKPHKSLELWLFQDSLMQWGIPAGVIQTAWGLKMARESDSNTARKEGLQAAIEAQAAAAESGKAPIAFPGVREHFETYHEEAMKRATILFGIGAEDVLDRTTGAVGRGPRLASLEDLFLYFQMLQLVKYVRGGFDVRSSTRKQKISYAIPGSWEYWLLSPESNLGMAPLILSVAPPAVPVQMAPATPAANPPAPTPVQAVLPSPRAAPPSNPPVTPPSNPPVTPPSNPPVTPPVQAAPVEVDSEEDEPISQEDAARMARKRRKAVQSPPPPDKPRQPPKRVDVVRVEEGGERPPPPGAVQIVADAEMREPEYGIDFPSDVAVQPPPEPVLVTSSRPPPPAPEAVAAGRVIPPDVLAGIKAQVEAEYRDRYAKGTQVIAHWHGDWNPLGDAMPPPPDLTPIFGSDVPPEFVQILRDAPNRWQREHVRQTDIVRTHEAGILKTAKDWETLARQQDADMGAHIQREKNAAETARTESALAVAKSIQDAADALNSRRQLEASLTRQKALESDAAKKAAEAEAIGKEAADLRAGIRERTATVTAIREEKVQILAEMHRIRQEIRDARTSGTLNADHARDLTAEKDRLGNEKLQLEAELAAAKRDLQNLQTQSVRELDALKGQAIAAAEARRAEADQEKARLEAIADSLRLTGTAAASDLGVLRNENLRLQGVIETAARQALDDMNRTRDEERQRVLLEAQGLRQGVEADLLATRAREAAALSRLSLVEAQLRQSEAGRSLLEAAQRNTSDALNREIERLKSENSSLQINYDALRAESVRFQADQGALVLGLRSSETALKGQVDNLQNDLNARLQALEKMKAENGSLVIEAEKNGREQVELRALVASQEAMINERAANVTELQARLAELQAASGDAAAREEAAAKLRTTLEESLQRERGVFQTEKLEMERQTEKLQREKREATESLESVKASQLKTEESLRQSKAALEETKTSGQQRVSDLEAKLAAQERTTGESQSVRAELEKTLEAERASFAKKEAGLNQEIRASRELVEARAEEALNAKAKLKRLQDMSDYNALSHKREIAKQEERLQTALRRAEAKQTELETAKEAHKELEKTGKTQSAKHQELIDRLEERIRTAEARTRESERELVDAQRGSADSEDRLTEAQEKLHAAEELAARRERELVDARKSTTESEADHQKRLAETQEKLHAAEELVAKREKELVDARKSTTESEADHQKRLTEAQEKLHAAEEKATDQERQLTKARARVEELTSQLTTTEGSDAALRVKLKRAEDQVKRQEKTLRENSITIEQTRGNLSSLMEADKEIYDLHRKDVEQTRSELEKTRQKVKDEIRAKEDAVAREAAALKTGESLKLAHAERLAVMEAHETQLKSTTDALNREIEGLKKDAEKERAAAAGILRQKAELESDVSRHRADIESRATELGGAYRDLQDTRERLRVSQDLTSKQEEAHRAFVGEREATERENLALKAQTEQLAAENARLQEENKSLRELKRAREADTEDPTKEPVEPVIYAPPMKKRFWEHIHNPAREELLRQRRAQEYRREAAWLRIDMATKRLETAPDVVGDATIETVEANLKDAMKDVAMATEATAATETRIEEESALQKQTSKINKAFRANVPEEDMRDSGMFTDFFEALPIEAIHQPAKIKGLYVEQVESSMLQYLESEQANPSTPVQIPGDVPFTFELEWFANLGELQKVRKAFFQTLAAKGGTTKAAIDLLRGMAAVVAPQMQPFKFETGYVPTSITVKGPSSLAVSGTSSFGAWDAKKIRA